MSTWTRKILKKVSPYFKEIRYNSNHYVCYLKNSDKVITISSTSRSFNFEKQVMGDFKRAGIVIH